MRSDLKALIVCSTVLALVCAPAFARVRSGGQQTPAAQSNGAPAKPPTVAAEDTQIATPAGKAPPDPAEAAASAAIGSYEGLRVASIRLQTAATTRQEHLLELITQKTDEPLDKNKIRESVQALFATGKFADVQVEADQAGQDRVALVFIAKENFFVGFIGVDGAPDPPNADQLINATKFQLGDLYTADKLQGAVDRMKGVMQDNGYYQSTITFDATPHPDNQQTDVQFHVRPGPAARIGKVTVEGEPGYSTDEIQKIAHLRSGDKVSASRINRALEKIRRKYQSGKRLEAQVAIPRRDYHPDTNTLDYVLKLVRGPKIDIHVLGASISRGRLKKYVPVFEENAVDEDLLNEGRRNLRDYFQTQGYFDADITVKQVYDPGADHRDIDYVVDLGKRHRLLSVVIEGNKYFDDDLLRERMMMQSSSLLMPHGRFSESIRSRDQESIEAVYQSNGFLDVKVTSEVQDDYHGHVGDMRVVFRLEEGAQTRVAALHLVGNRSFPNDDLTGLINTAQGEPYSDANITSDRDAIQNFYFNRGFPEVRVDTAAKAAGAHLREVTYTIDEGSRVYVDRVLLSGLHYTQPFVARREFRLWDGDPLSQGRMLGTQRRLYDLGIFNEVNMAVQNPEGSATYKNVLVQVDEARRWTFNYGVGFEVQTGSASQACPSSLVPELLTLCKARFASLFAGQVTASPRVSLGVTRINFRGRDQTIVFKGNVGRLEQQALLSFEEPRWFDRDNMKLTLSTYYDNSRDVQTFTARRVEAAAQVEHTLSRITTLLYRFSYRRVVAVDNTLVLSVEQVPILSQPVRVGMPSFTYLRDKRDNPIETHKGNYTTVDFGSAWSIFGSEANFNRLNFQNSTYQQFGRSRWVFARSTRIGVAEPFGGPVRSAGGAMVAPYIPLPERFFAGGGNSLRGFDLNGAGPRDLAFGTPLGGGGMFINNLELRTPPVTLPFIQDNVSFVLFEDAGNVLNDPGDIPSSFLRTAQQHREDCRSLAKPQGENQCGFNYLSHALGAGIRYRTPIGPVRVDVGYNLNPPTFPRYCINGCVNGAPIAPGDVHTLGRINFYFSIGQTF